MSLFTCPLPLFLLSSSLHCCCALLLHRLLRKARPKRADATRGWSDCGEASARVSAAAKTTYPRVPNRTNGSRTRLPLELEPATFTSRSAFILPSFYLFIYFFFFLVIQLDLPFYGSLNMRVLLGRCSIWDASRFTSRVACPCARKRSKCSE